ncbi:MAG: DUF3794 domain-containing protein [Ruminococcus sp.]|nr:DUF3794 domain-containing protein [Ruminococcus sp.]
MDLRISRETVPAAECIWNGLQEQSVELDYILPDYYPDIFRLVRCEVSPVITGCSVSSYKLSYELRCDIKILYCTDGDSIIRCISQKQSFSRSAELGKACSDPIVKISAKTDHINYRAVNKRRLDMRAAVSVRIDVSGVKNQEVISDVSGMNVQLRKIPVNFASAKINAEKIVRISEETEISAAQPAIISVITSRCIPDNPDTKIISGKLLAKGEVNIRLLYSCEKDGKGTVEPMSFSVPYSQITDMEGLDDSFSCIANAEIISCELTPAGDKNNDNRILKYEIEIKLSCDAVKTSSLMIAADAYSTVYPCDVSFSDISARQLPIIYRENFRHTAKLSEGENTPVNIFAMWVTPKNINTRLSEDGTTVTVTGMLTYSMAAEDNSGMIVMPDRDEAFEQNISIDNDISGSSLSALINVTDVSYNISSEGVLTAKADISAEISASGSSSVRAVSDILIDEKTKKQRDGDYAIKLYFGVKGENVWDIAKRYSTSVDSVIEENELMGDTVENDGMLLIPIVDG